MHWKGLRLVADGSSKRQSTIESQPQARRSEHLPRPLAPINEPRYSESTPRFSDLVDSRDINADGDGTAPRLQVPGERGPEAGVARADFAAGPSTGDTPSLRRNRFSFMRLRHASDPQLSKSYAKAEDAPPVPSLPPPKIITTAPTSHELDQPVKQRHKLRLRPSSRKHSMDELSRSSGDYSRKSERKHQGSTDSHIADSSLSTYQTSAPEEPGRLSTTSIRSGGRDQTFNDSQQSSVSATDTRFSESSRSDQSYGDQTFRTNSPRDGQGSANKRFRMPRLKRHRSPLFPLPPKLPPTSNNFPPAETAKSDTSDHDQISPLPSPQRSSVGLAGPSAPPLLRNNSTNSARSIRSNPSHKGRGRSSTMGSLAENNVDETSPVPYLASSGRTSTSTSGRKSFGDIFSISQRLRQNSEPPIPRNGSPGIGGAATPIKADLPPIPAREEGETPAAYLTKLEESLPRGMIGGILAQSDDEFYKVGLRKYMRSFSYFGDPIDMAIRKLLMEVELPKETQQIDRFLQAFADRYHECNPGIFASTDQAYFIAFSILILHTDVFNKNNKRKMQKPDYVKNCRGEGIAEDILECFYENISYTPFIHVEDANLRDRHLAKPRRALFKSTSSDHLPLMAREPVDPYTLIMDNKLGTLKPSLKDVMDLEDTYNHVGTSGTPDMDDLHQAFTKSGILQIISLRSRPDAFMQASLDNPADSHPGLVDIKVAKVGLLWRKDPKKKRARSPWAEWGAVLTFSQLYFFRNVTWVRTLMAQHDAYVRNGRKGTLVFRPPLAEFKPDGIMSTNDAVALLDDSYKKHKHAFSFVRPNALEEVFLATSEPEMNDWIAKLNYAAAFRTTGVRTKGMIATNYEGQRYRRSQRVGSVSSLGSNRSGDREPESPSIDNDIVAEFVAARRQLMSQKIRDTNEKLFVTQKQLEDLLRNARHLQVLTPVTPRARENVIMAAARMAAKLKWVRQDIWRNKCYREVLLRDLGEEETATDERTGSVAGPTVSTVTEPARVASVSGPSIASEPSIRGAPSIGHATSSHDIPEEPAVSTPVEKPCIDTGFLSEPSDEEMRRPSIQTSTTSSDVGRVGRPLSIAIVSEGRSDSASHLEREASVLSRGSKFDGASLGSRASKITSPVSYDDSEERLLRETGLLDLGGSPPPRKPSATVPEDESESKPEESSEVSQSDNNRPSRVRRSLHRTLREPHHVHRHHSRHKKNRDSVSSLNGPEDDGSESSGLARKTPSFTVHGKKASIITFGSEWQNMPPEERLKLRKPTPHEEPRASDPVIAGSGESVTSDNLPADHRHSYMSVSTTTGLSLRSDDETIDFFKDAQETFTPDSPKRPVSQAPGQELEQPLAPDQPAPELENKLPSTSGTGTGSVIYGNHLTAPGETTSPSSTSLNERVVDTPSSENLRQQAVGA
ncbi:uncharacterized protein N7496_008799 [Penicillium cataractarum]|uniref:Guanyl-nucleotide exchange factor n=1 Tax=Penicillium cataractarum TaxID=2100454 RepID=A0A9W9V626_9EURO|nr:uncharacterized protein N7496_008799 [Penicillium cataractarum]KAJ5369039.1 hypothetical protein N7496_008799 [Penicillium cataractarum]